MPTEKAQTSRMRNVHYNLSAEVRLLTDCLDTGPDSWIRDKGGGGGLCGCTSQQQQLLQCYYTTQQPPIYSY